MRVLFAGKWRGQVEGRLLCWTHQPALAVLLTPVRNAAWMGARLRALLNPQPVARVPVPVISIGNIAVGGTGKTPLTQWLVQRLYQWGERPAVLTPLPSTADEVQEHQTVAFPDGDALSPSSPQSPISSPHLVYTGRDRVASAQRAIADGATVLVLDDGFQYRCLHRDLDIVLWDATAWLHPVNPLLREPLTALRRASVIVLTKADALPPLERERLCQRLAQWSGGKKVIAAFGYAPVAVVPQPPVPSPLPAKEQQTRVVAVTSVANPFYFALTAQRAGFEVATLICFPDHYAFTQSDAAFVAQVARTERAVAVLTTRKDAVKWRSVWCEPLPLWVLQVRLQWLWGEAELWEVVEKALRQ